MASFNQEVINKTLRLEGGLSTRVTDRGNYITPKGNWVSGDYPYRSDDGGSPIFIGSKYGISAPAYSKYLGRPCTKPEMANLSEQIAIDIYEKDYWNRNRLDYVHSQALAVMIFDGCVNQGNEMDAILQRTLNEKFNKNLKVDYQIGRKTITEANSVNAYILHDALRAARLAHYEKVRKRPGQAEYADGWIARIEAFPPLFGQDYATAVTTAVDDEYKPAYSFVTDISITADEYGEKLNDWFVRNTPIKNKVGRNNVFRAKLTAGLSVAVFVASIFYFLTR